jgi:hypothetical protein
VIDRHVMRFLLSNATRTTAQILRLHDAPTHTVASDSTGKATNFSLSCRAAAARDLPAANSDEPLPSTLPPTPTKACPRTAQHSTQQPSPAHPSRPFACCCCWPHFACPCVPPRSRPTPTAAYAALLASSVVACCRSRCSSLVSSPPARSFGLFPSLSRARRAWAAAPPLHRGGVQQNGPVTPCPRCLIACAHSAQPAPPSCPHSRSHPSFSSLSPPPDHPSLFASLPLLSSPVISPPTTIANTHHPPLPLRISAAARESIVACDTRTPWTRPAPIRQSQHLLLRRR